MNLALFNIYTISNSKFPDEKWREVLKALLEHGANPNAADQEGYTILMDAVKIGDVASIRILLDHGADIHQKAEVGTTALMHAACVDSKKAEYLIQRGANIHQSDHEGDTPLHFAIGFPWDDQAKANRAKMVKVLLAHGAQNVPGKGGKTPLDLAQQEKLTEVVQLIQGAVRNRQKP